MPDERHPDPLEPALDALLNSYAAVSPTAEAEARWRLNLRLAPGPDRCLGLSARSWALACAVCLLLTCGLAGLAWRQAWARSAPPAPRIVFSPPPAPVFITPAAVRPEPKPALVRMVQSTIMPVVVPKSSRVAVPTPQEILLTRLVEEKPAVLAQMLKGVPTAPFGEQQ